MPAHDLAPDAPIDRPDLQRWSLKCDECGETEAGPVRGLRGKGWAWSYTYNEETGEVLESEAKCGVCNPRYDADERENGRRKRMDRMLESLDEFMEDEQRDG